MQSRVPFGVTTGRRGALYGIGLALVLALGYWLLMTVFIAMGSAAVLPAPRGAWGAPNIFSAGAAKLTHPPPTVAPGPPRGPAPCSTRSTRA